MRVTVTLACSECKQRNYNTTKNKKNIPDRIELKKYCKFCKTHTSHKEAK
ncbi:MAG: 50S ribosomal protein L33 [Peptococcia bacterium]